LGFVVLYENMFYDVGTAREDLKVGFRYDPSWGMNIKAKPSKNGVLKSSYMKGTAEYLRFLCLNFYHFTYDVIYPVEVIIKDKNAFGGKCYNFRYMFLVVVENNEANRESFTSSSFIIPEYDEGFCKERGNDVVEIRAISNGIELSNVNITYICIDKMCELGKTTYDSSARTNNLITTLPLSCSNPVLMANKEGYVEARKQISDEDIKAGKIIEIDMKKIRPLELEVVKDIYSSESKEFIKEEEIGEKDNVTILMTNKYFTEYKIYPQDKIINLVEDDLKYDLNVVLLRYGDWAGGYMDSINIGKEDVINSNKIIIHVVDYRPSPMDDEEKGKMAFFLSNDEGYKKRLRPELR